MLMKSVTIKEKGNDFISLEAKKYPDCTVYIHVGSRTSAYCIRLDKNDRERLVKFLKGCY